MRVSFNCQPSFKGLWEAKEKDFNVAGLGNVWDVSYVYHPFKDENIDGKEASLKKQVPKDFIHQPDPELLRTLYCNHYELGKPLDVTEEDFLADKDGVINGLPKNYAQTTEELPAEKLFNLDNEMKNLDDYWEIDEKISPEDAKKLYDDTMAD